MLKPVQIGDYYRAAYFLDDDTFSLDDARIPKRLLGVHFSSIEVAHDRIATAAVAEQKQRSAEKAIGIFAIKVVVILFSILMGAIAFIFGEPKLSALIAAVCLIAVVLLHVSQRQEEKRASQG